jgi:disulfide bond formation protein DsbB
MSVDTASLFFALLAVACLLAIVGVVGTALVWRAIGRPSSLYALRLDVGRVAVPVAWVVATVTTLGSLYYSEIADFVPCRLCWYQRICMYPLAVILGVAALRRDRGVRFYVLPVAVIGALIAAYHSWIQAYPPEGGTSFCTLDAPCTERYVWEFGFVSLPLMALISFVFISTMMVLARPASDEMHDEDQSARNFGDPNDDLMTEADQRLLEEQA